MSQTVYLIFLLVTLLTIISTPVNASPLQRRTNNCCPVSKCVFKKEAKPSRVNGVNIHNINYYGNTFNGFLSFVETPKSKLQITGWIDIFGVTNSHFKPETDIGYDIHVAKCNTVNSPPEPQLTPGDPAIIDLDKQNFGEPIITSVSKSINDIKNQCCFVVEEYASLGPISGGKPSKPRNERILGIAPIKTVVSC